MRTLVLLTAMLVSLGSAGAVSACDQVVFSSGAAVSAQVLAPTAVVAVVPQQFVVGTQVLGFSAAAVQVEALAVPTVVKSSVVRQRVRVQQPRVRQRIRMLTIVR